MLFFIGLFGCSPVGECASEGSRTLPEGEFDASVPELLGVSGTVTVSDDILVIEIVGEDGLTQGAVYRIHSLTDE